jgi:hypothetical protein
VSVLDDLRAAEQRVAKRLKELEPAVAEYRELEAVAQRLGIDAAATSPPSEPKAAPRRRRTSRAAASAKPAPSTRRRRRSRGNAAPGQRAEQLLELVRARPGITVREAGQEFGVDPTSLYRVVHRLEQGGQVQKNGRGLEPAGTAT